MTTTQVLIALLTSAGIGAAIVEFVKGVIKWLSGGATREKERNTSLISQRRHAIEERDEANERGDREAARRRKADEYASKLRRMLIENGINPGKWYTDPVDEIEVHDTLDPEELKRLREVRKQQKEGE